MSSRPSELANCELAPFGRLDFASKSASILAPEPRISDFASCPSHSPSALLPIHDLHTTHNIYGYSVNFQNDNNA